MRILELNEKTQDTLLKELAKRSPGTYAGYAQTVQEIIDSVREKGDEALFAYTEKFDHVSLTAENIKVTEEELEEAIASVDKELLSVMQRSMDNIRIFHEKQRQQSWIDTTPDGTILGQRVTPLESVGLYVPGGKAAYPSSVLMNLVPAKVAGVERIIIVTPPGRDGKVSPVTLAAAKIGGADEIYKAGGAQAIAALAFGTESIPRVDKITGPGNIFVTLAKKAVYGHVSIDSIAGPSEVTVLADDTANARYVAADLLSQAEHDELACSILVTDSRRLAEEVSAAAEEMIEKLERRDILRSSVDNYGYILLTDSMKDAADAVNKIAPEHLEIQTANPFETMTMIKNAGAIFLGEHSSEPLGDYYAGPNHVLPTNGTARFFSPLGVDAFVKKSSIIYYSKEALLNAADDIIRFAESEGLTAHANSIRIRKES